MKLYIAKDFADIGKSGKVISVWLFERFGTTNDFGNHQRFGFFAGGSPIWFLNEGDRDEFVREFGGAAGVAEPS
ncbi:hypothetical protein AY600_02085 [Phormidium willei BDU 130791]|nr:hypothetical protein AY600_02085 [Phormidium willei BDU 130791]